MDYFGPIWVGFRTCDGMPTREGPSLIRNLGVHHKFGRVWCGCLEGVGSSPKLGIRYTMSSTNLGSCPICSCIMLCLGFTPFNVAFMFSFSIHVTFCWQMPHSWKVTLVMYIAFQTFHPLRISMHLVQHQSSIVFVGVDFGVKFSFSFLKISPHYLVLKNVDNHRFH